MENENETENLILMDLNQLRLRPLYSAQITDSYREWLYSEIGFFFFTNSCIPYINQW